MKQVIFATSNQSKIDRFSNSLAKRGIKLVSLKDLNVNLEIDENGHTNVENALMKAKACYEKTHMPSIGMDDALYMENVPEDKQPGLFVRRVNGKSLNDEEMLDYYINLVKEYGKDGKINCEWRYGLACINEKGEASTFTWSKGNFYMVEQISDKRNPGYPLNSISKYKGIDKYLTDVSEEEKKLLNATEDNVVDFIEKHT